MATNIYHDCWGTIPSLYLSNEMLFLENKIRTKKKFGGGEGHIKAAWKNISWKNEKEAISILGLLGRISTGEAGRGHFRKNKTMKKWWWGRISSCRQLYTLTRKKCTPFTNFVQGKDVKKHGLK